ncbi:diguanylate cyclase [Novosphingobium profundi]|uniref:GGDEF domain-containing protein n=1 Tax=Novosphingobium profundi TaxID=1774954 RepID=UPI001BD95A6C|nr:diguanylate cyclase [Novosphingobium profundi]MBT0669112.1 diguanylate cyclase [Novosphingobium profundi]
MTLRYVVALGLIALLSIVSHLVLTETLKANEGSAAIINMSGRQRMLSQRIRGLADDLHSGKEVAREPLITSMNQFRQTHERLAALADAKGTIAERRLYEVYYGNAEIDRLMTRFLAAGERIAARKVAPARLTDAEDSQDLQVLSDLARGPLLSGLEDVVSIHQSVSEARSQRMVRVQWGILLIVLVTLAVEACFIFRPMVRAISGYVGLLLNQADHDYLTGLLNRRAFTVRAEAEIQRSRRYARPVSVVLVDVDHFKRVNDSLGHLAGDTVLVTLSRTMEAQARREDVIARLGGEEFAILLPETGLAEACEMAERLRQAVAAEPILAGEEPRQITISAGVAEIDLDGARPYVSAMSNADKMLYRAKDAGRDTVRPKPASARAMRVVS